MPIRPVREQHGGRTTAAHELDRALNLIGPADLTIRPLEILTPRRAQHIRTGSGFGHSDFNCAVSPEFTAGQITKTDCAPLSHLFGNRAADPNFDVVRVRSERQEIDRRVHPPMKPGTGSNAL
jgi:hypothetical protein